MSLIIISCLKRRLFGRNLLESIILFDQYASGRSNILECLAIEAGQEEKPDKRASHRFFYMFGEASKDCSSIL